ncbi:hypothetical protein SAMN04490207_6158 [Pseudomonas gessardii]|uniref:hypothetical protein n=1 Tax=Pseudomonas gessardii TaxID=78544 RepID=UPI0008816AD9|nr:hypothetical protein [Pseudomonas gessardii]MRU53001.1 hypothetical protein [Pseudomonas gessardii]ONH38955.1 hypothetical protein BLL38_21615 [Pseudomonas gessardii]SDR40966.1 hypothetical protein SAMN04490207_6158 [Pseudomonas gessardii]
MTTNQTIGGVPRGEPVYQVSDGVNGWSDVDLLRYTACCLDPEEYECRVLYAEHPAPVAPPPINYGALDPVERLAVCRGEVAAAVPVIPELTAELRWIFGLMCFQCIHYAQGLRRLGRSIPEKAEHEQAAVIHWMLCHYMKDPVNWRLNAASEMKSVAPET